MAFEKLAEIIFPSVEHDREYYIAKYPKRNLKEGARVTRYAPSPTGFQHIGGVFAALINERLASQSEGIFYLRIEDTDQKREVENGVIGIINALKEFDMSPDEGMIDEENYIGDYGPYKQSLRKEIYQSYAKHLVEKGYAYPCFCTSEELEEMRQKQEVAKIRTGYYGVWDIVIIKSDGLPTYHSAHAVDDHLMGTNLVIRGDEWLSSVPLHLQLFYCLGFKAPKYAHIAPIMKEENGAKRKLSKRKDPEAAVSYYSEIGIPEEAVDEYLLNIANSNFEQWRRQNKDAKIEEFDLQLNKMSVSGALFDIVKLLDISKRVISKYTKEKVYNETINWASKYDSKLKELLENNKEYSLKVLGIERGNIKPRRDIAKWSDVKENIIYMYDDEFYKSTPKYEFPQISDMQEIKDIISTYIEKYYNAQDDKETWFNKIKDLAEAFGYAKEVKEYKQNPDAYKGHVGDISTLIRVALTTRTNTPDMYEIMNVLGENSVKERLQYAIKNI